MISTRGRIYSYLMFVFITICLVSYISNISVDNQSLQLDCKNILPNTKLRLRCDVNTNQSHFIMPNLTSILNKDKILSSFGLEYDYWAMHTYEAKIKISDNPDRSCVPQNEYIILGDPIKVEVNPDGKIVYIIPIIKPQELEKIIISSYTDNCVGIFGEISYLFDRVYANKLTMREFNRTMVCINKIIYPSNGENKNAR